MPQLCVPGHPSCWSKCDARAASGSDLHGYHAARRLPGGFCFLFVALDSHDLPTRLRPGREIRE